MTKTTVKQKAARLVNELPENASWEELMYKIYVLQSIDEGLKDSDNNKIFSVKEVRKNFGLSK